MFVWYLIFIIRSTCSLSQINAVYYIDPRHPKMDVSLSPSSRLSGRFQGQNCTVFLGRIFMWVDSKDRIALHFLGLPVGRFQGQNCTVFLGPSCG